MTSMDKNPPTWTGEELATFLPQPTANDHKYTRGICGVLAGSQRYPGAALLAVQAALATGCGMVLYSGPETIASYLMLKAPEAVIGQKSSEEEKVTAWVIGPGAVGEERTQDIRGAFASGHPAIIDAAALEPAAQWVIDQGKFTPAQILTPHRGELIRLLTWLYALAPEEWVQETDRGEPRPEELEKDPGAWTRLAAQLTGATVMLKGSTAYIASPNGSIYSYRAKTSWLATAGSGDTLSGILGSLLAQHTARWEQAGHRPGEEDYARLTALGVHLHNLAALEAHGGKTGPVPPSLVSQHIARAISRLITPNT